MPCPVLAFCLVLFWTLTLCYSLIIFVGVFGSLEWHISQAFYLCYSLLLFHARLVAACHGTDHNTGHGDVVLCDRPYCANCTTRHV